MKESKRRRLEAAGWRFGSADDLIGLSWAESRAVEARAAEARAATSEGARVPEGWTIEPLPRQPDYVLISTPAPQRYMATVDFRARGFRSGYSTTGRFVGEEWNKRRKKYGGRGWRQVLVDDAVASLGELLR